MQSGVPNPLPFVTIIFVHVLWQTRFDEVVEIPKDAVILRSGLTQLTEFSYPASVSYLQ